MDGRTLEPQSSPALGLAGQPFTQRSLALHCVAWLAGLAAYHLLLRYLMTEHGLRLGAVSHKLAPLYAYWRPHLKGWLVIPLLVLGCYCIVLRRTRLVTGWSDRRAACVLTVCFGLIATAVAMLDSGPRSVVAPLLRTDLEYFGAVDRVDGVARFMREYPSRAATMPMHAQVHPPGAVLFLWPVAALFGSKAWLAAAWIIGFSSLCVPIVFGWANRLAGPGTARRAAVLVSLTPSVVLFVATSMDGPFAVFLLATMWWFWESLWPGESAATGTAYRQAILAGLAATAAALMTYSVTVALLFCGVAWLVCWVSEPARRRATLAVAAIAAGTFLLAHGLLWLVTGYDPIEMFFVAVRNSNHIMSGTRHESMSRYLHIAVGNLVVFFAAAGLPCAAIWWRAVWGWLRGVTTTGPAMPAETWLSPLLCRLLATSLITLLVAAAVPVYVLEVERVWLFLAPLVTIPVAAILFEHERGTGQIRYTMTVALLLIAQTLVTEVFLTTYW